jgi:hypothetical protein
MNSDQWAPGGQGLSAALPTREVEASFMSL